MNIKPFRITWVPEYAEYRVNIPSYDGGEVVHFADHAAEVERLKSVNADYLHIIKEHQERIAKHEAESAALKSQIKEDIEAMRRDREEVGALTAEVTTLRAERDAMHPTHAEINRLMYKHTGISARQFPEEHEGLFNFALAVLSSGSGAESKAKRTAEWCPHGVSNLNICKKCD